DLVFHDVGVQVPPPAPFLAFCGSSSAVEHHLAKVGVAGSNPVFRSKNLQQCAEAGVAEMVDAQDLKSCGRYPTVPVRFRPSAPSEAPVAQLDRALDYGSRGLGLNYSRARYDIYGIRLDV